MNDQERTYTSFAGSDLIVRGSLTEMLQATKALMDAGEDRQILIFDDRTGQQVDFDFRGTAQEVIDRVEPQPAAAGRGRPKLGVVSREVSLLPRHWEWLEQQPNGISAAIRRLVDEARKREPGKERARRARDAASRVMWVMAGNLPGFEEASRALFADNKETLFALMVDWPHDIRTHLQELVTEADRLERSTDAAADLHPPQ